ncbi:MAG: hypothetical protein F7B17_08700 [Desulfurococcales archaeon]|nr:hypothetical protein [Desulfurococcales archaeon]
MSECPTAVIVAKPKRQSWALEEAWDLAVASHPEGRAEATRFPGVILVYTPERDPYRFSVIAARGSRGFIQRIVPAEKCLTPRTPEDITKLVEAAFSSVLNLAAYKGVRLIASMRGRVKELLDVNDIINTALKAGVKLDRKGKAVVAVEGIDDIVIISAGITYQCGPSCLLVYLKR